MKTNPLRHQISLYIAAFEPKFLIASAMPMLVGSALGYAVTDSFSFGVFLLAFASILCIHAGSNAGNDYFDHLSGNDWANKHPTPFSGGNRLIQEGLLSPRAMLIEAITFWAIGAALGILLLVITKSTVILTLGLVGLLGGFFYTAPPIKLCYRTLGEPAIGFLFGILPVTGAYYLQSRTIDANLIAPAVIIASLIYLVILINEFPDLACDTETNKKTLVVRFGVGPCIIIYRVVLAMTYAVAAITLFFNTPARYASIAYFLTLPLSISLFRLANKKEVTTVDRYVINARTIQMHSAGALTLTVGFIIWGLTH